MDGDVRQNIDIFQATNSKAIDSIIDSSTNYIRQLSSSSFLDNFDNTVESSIVNVPTTTRVTQQQKSNSSGEGLKAKDSPNLSTKPCQSGCKRQRTPERKRSRISQDTSALDCSDYWLRFDSDDDSLDNSFSRLSDYDTQFSSTKHRTLGLIQPAPKIKRIGQTDNFKLAYQSPVADLIEDSAGDHALSEGNDSFAMALDDDILKKDPTQPQDIAPERLYSTPLSWETPQPGVELMDSYFSVNPAFNDPERQRLLAIAMGTGMAPGTSSIIRPRPSTSAEFNFDMHQSPTSDTTTNTPEPTCKTSLSKFSRSSPRATEKPKEKPKGNERAAHNDIERKYRTNLKDRIADLREAIPSLRSAPEDDQDEDDSPIMSSRAPKVSKGTVLTKATEYIRQLERRNRSMAQKNEELTRRLQAFEQLLGASPGQHWQPQGYGTALFNPRGYPS